MNTPAKSQKGGRIHAGKRNHHEEGVDLLPANIELSGLEVSLGNTMSREMILRDYIEQIRDLYDYILIDCMPSLGVMTINDGRGTTRITRL